MKLHTILLDPNPAVAPEGGGTAVADAPDPGAAAPEPGVLEDKELDAAFENPFGSLDEKVKPKPAETKTDKADDKTKPDSKTAPKPEEKKVDPKAKVDPKPAKPEEFKGKTAGLKENHDRLLNEKKELEAKYRDLESKYAKAEAAGKDTSKLAERLAAVEKERDEVRGELAAARFMPSDEFKAKHQGPWDRMWQRIQSEVKGMKVITGQRNDETGEVPTRAATMNDFLELKKMPLPEALEMTDKYFTPAAASLVKQRLTALDDMEADWNASLENEKASWQKKQQEAEATRIREQEAIGSMWEKVNADITSKNPEWFGEDPNDPEGNALLKEGYELVDSAYGKNNLTLQQKVILDANIRHRAAAFARDQHKITKLTARVAELEEKLAGKKSTAPGAVRRDGDSNTPEPETPILQDPGLEEAFR